MSPLPSPSTRWFGGGLAIVGVVLLLAGCGSNGEPSAGPRPADSLPIVTTVPIPDGLKGSAPASTLTFNPVIVSAAGAAGPPGADLPTLGDLGPSALDGNGAVGAVAGEAPNGQWSVQITLVDGPDGIGAFNQLAGVCFQRVPSCPSGQAAIVLDGVVLMAPRVQTPSFEADQIQVSTASNDEAVALANRITAASHG